MTKEANRLRRARKTRAKISQLKIPRLCVFRSNKHIYAQIFSSNGDRVLVSASTVEKGIDVSSTSTVSAATEIGNRIAEKAKSLGLEKVAFDRSGFQYHGRIKALAEAARESGLSF